MRGLCTVTAPSALGRSARCGPPSPVTRPSPQHTAWQERGTQFWGVFATVLGVKPPRERPASVRVAARRPGELPPPEPDSSPRRRWRGSSIVTITTPGRHRAPRPVSTPSPRCPCTVGPVRPAGRQDLGRPGRLRRLVASLGLPAPARRRQPPSTPSPRLPRHRAAVARAGARPLDGRAAREGRRLRRHRLHGAQAEPSRSPSRSPRRAVAWPRSPASAPRPASRQHRAAAGRPTPAASSHRPLRAGRSAGTRRPGPKPGPPAASWHRRPYAGTCTGTAAPPRPASTARATPVRLPPGRHRPAPHCRGPARGHHPRSPSPQPGDLVFFAARPTTWASTPATA